MFRHHPRWIAQVVINASDEVTRTLSICMACSYSRSCHATAAQLSCHFPDRHVCTREWQRLRREHRSKGTIEGVEG